MQIFTFFLLTIVTSFPFLNSASQPDKKNIPVTRVNENYIESNEIENNDYLFYVTAIGAPAIIISIILIFFVYPDGSEN